MSFLCLISSLLDDERIIRSNAVRLVIGHRGVFENTAVPDVRKPETFQFFQTLIIDIVHLSYAIRFDRTVDEIGQVSIAE